MSVTHPPFPIGCLVALGAVGVSLFGCSSSQQLDSIESHLSQIQQEIAVVQDHMSSREDLAQMESRVAGDTDRLLRSEADVRQEVGVLADRISELEAQLADMIYRIDQLSQQVAVTNQELSALLAVIPMGGEGAVSPTRETDPDLLYHQAYRDYRNRSYDLAIEGFREYLASFPDTDFADNASYYLGECYFNQRRYQQAVTEFSGVLARYPRSEVLRSAMLRRAVAYLALGESAEGVLQLERLIRDYPSSDEARLAREQLQELQRKTN